MFEIPHYMNKDEYLQVPVLKTFCMEHKLRTTNTKPELIKSIKTFANESELNEKETIKWLSPKIKEGSKEFCYKKIYNINPTLYSETVIERYVKEKYPYYRERTLFSFNYEKETKCVNYKVLKNGKNELEIISFTFAKKVLEGEFGSDGNISIYPVFIDVYLKEGFIVGRGKAKSTLYEYNEDRFLYKDNRICTQNYIVALIDEIISCFKLSTETNVNVIKSDNEKMLYKLFDKYSFTPQPIEECIKEVENLNTQYCRELFKRLGLSILNLKGAFSDLRIFTEKYVSINGDNEYIFKEDRNAYLVKMTSDDVQETTHIDTSSSWEKPLQCTEAFFDSKKPIINSKKCQNINLCFKRKNRIYFGNNPFIVKFTTKSQYGTFKITHYAEEVDIQYVLQTIFENY